MEHAAVDQEFACEECGFTSPIANEICPNCSGRMLALDAPSKRKTAIDDSEEDDLADSSGGPTDEEGQELSLQQLQEKELAEDEPDYGDGDE